MPARTQSCKSASCCAQRARQSPGKFRFELAPWYHNIPDKELIADLRRVARLLGAKTLLKKEYRSHSKFTSSTPRDRFGSWNAALKKAGLEPSHHHDVTARIIVADIRRVARKLKTNRLSATQYHAHSPYRHGLLRRRFGTWPKATRAAGLVPTQYNKVSVHDLFENLENVWRTLGRQPTRAEMMYPLSKYGIYAYDVRYHGFRNALAALVKWKVKNRNRKIPTPPPKPCPKKPRRFHGGRKINLRLRFEVLQRDHFTCRACGRSPANERGVRLQVDHILAWSAGGETVKENLQTLCQQCNLGKSNR